MPRPNKLPPFVAVYKDLLADKKWRSLSSSAKIVYIYMRGKFNTKNLSEVSLSYTEMSDMMSTATLSNAFKELQEEGFIIKKKTGGLYGGVTTYTFNGQYGKFGYKGIQV